MKIVQLYALLTVIASVYCKITSYHLGFMVNDISLENDIDTQIRHINANPRAFGVNKNIQFNESVHLLQSDAINITTDICDNFISNQVYIMLMTNPNSTVSPSIVSYACAFYTIPVIAIQARETEYSDKSLHPTTLRMVPSYADQARVITKVIQFFQLNKVNVIASNDFDGRNTYIKFTTHAYKSGISIENTVIIPPDENNVKPYVKALKTSQSKVIVLLSSTSTAIQVYKSATELSMNGEGYIWIANEQSLVGDAFKEAPQGVLGCMLNEDVPKSIEKAIGISVKAISDLYDKKLMKSKPPKSCDEPAREWETGKELYSALINSTLDGVKFDWNGDSLNATYSVVNVKIDDSTGEKSLVNVGNVNEHASLDRSMIRWPGGLTDIPSGSFVSTFLKIVTVRSKPFVYTIKNTTECDKIVELNSKDKRVTFIPCKEGNVTMCCKGYCMELLQMLANRLNFTYELHLVEDGQFGSLKKVGDSNIKRWNGMVGEVIEGKADLIVASLTINNERAQYIEFSKPFKYQGITILVKDVNEKPGLASFLRPFKTELWILVLISVHVVALILYLLDRLSPFGRYRLAQANKEENALNLSSAMWFSWGVLLNSGIGEGTPRSFSARVLGMVWAGFAMIIVASYTANLAAFLVLDRPKPVATGIDDPKMRNPSSSFKYATVTNSSVDAYFRRQVELSAMYTHMTKYNVKNDSDGIAQVKAENPTLQAFIWDSPVLLHETSYDCDLVTVGELFGRSGYGIGMPKGFSWSENISLSILHFHESGAMEELESTWIKFGNCEKDKTSAATLGLEHMLGVFIMVAGGIGAGIVIVILEVLYYKHKGWRKQQQKVLKKTTEQWQEHVLDKKIERQNNSKVFNRETAQRRSVKFNDVDTQQIGLNNPTFENTRESITSSH